jgi:uncharacterized protein YegJ (DUF2314 family)
MNTNRIVLGLVLFAGLGVAGLVAWNASRWGGFGAQRLVNDKGIAELTSGDAEMNVAIAAARSSAGEFIKALSGPCAACRNFTVKKRFPTPDGDFEHIWIDAVRLENGEFVGTIANEPVSIPNLRFGDTARVKINDMSDWFYTIDGEIVGGRTIKVLWDRATPAERETDFKGVRFRAPEGQPSR